MKKAAIGIDIGGTHIKSGLIGTDGTILERRSTPTEAREGKQGLLGKLDNLIGDYERIAAEQNWQLAGIGIGTAGYVNLQGGIGSATDNLPGWQGTSLRDELEAGGTMPLFVENDVNALALGEQWLGAGQGRDDFICLALGTGIGGCLVTGGRPYRGRNGYAGAYGHQTIVADGLPCTCGLRGCWERYASVTALKRMASEQAGSREWSVSPEAVFAAAREGVEEAERIIDRYSAYIAIGIANLIHSFNPTAVLIGGAVTAQGDFLFERVRGHVRSCTLHGFANEPELEILPAALGGMAGTIGAAKLVWNGIEKRSQAELDTGVEEIREWRVCRENS
ncbi:ROK family protein [Cohnella thailandensis]|uniref:ROK family protein n=1 Tax=Cohnella thailandensis TaxID=557557 RepID=A0A841SXC7_9BACL|nr:ROK family protein [Cohnella thailandensis]MBB6634828.1 ROK family protein [Cohnella thailandensis]MBP1975951.1 glucokinase [Cohnella thailandensis]